jgi:hypothetical protein
MYSGSRQAHSSCCSYSPPCPPQFYAVYVPVICCPTPAECCETLKVPHDLDVQQATTPQQALVGGTLDVSLSLEYLVETGAASPSVTLTTASGGATSTWTDAAPAVGYHVQEGVLSVQPGTKVTLAVNNATARVRWCETICC